MAGRTHALTWVFKSCVSGHSLTTSEISGKMYKSLYNSLEIRMARHISISEARGKLPQIARLLKRSPDKVVLIEHRDMDDRLAIMSERHLRNLESIVKSLKEQFSKPFRLAGSMESRLSDRDLEKALESIRKEQETAAATKLKDL